MRRELLGRLQAAWQGLADKPEETPETTLDALWAFAGLPEPQEGGPEPDEGRVAALRALVARRLEGEPLSYLVGRQTFMGLELLAGPEAMIPRKETEILGFAALGLLRSILARQDSAVVVDLCTGSGNLALALASHMPACRVHGSDLSEDAVRLAIRNAEFLGLGDRVDFRAGDFTDPFLEGGFPGTVDLLTCNPPYISSARVDTLPHEIGGFEPRAAFDGGAFGIKLLARLVKEAPALLVRGGWVACETGLGQGEPLARMFQQTKAYREVLTFCDDASRVRAVAAQTH